MKFRALIFANLFRKENSADPYGGIVRNLAGPVYVFGGGEQRVQQRG